MTEYGHLYGLVRHCSTCEVSWRGTDPLCWVCSEPGRESAPLAMQLMGGAFAWSATFDADPDYTHH